MRTAANAMNRPSFISPAGLSSLLLRKLGAQLVKSSRSFKSAMDALLLGVAGPEERALRLAAWCATRLSIDNSASTQFDEVVAHRRGPAGTRTRLYMAMVEAAGGQAKLFAFHSGIRRHTATQVLVDGAYRFVDPLCGCVCRVGGRLLSFSEMNENPQQAADGIELLSFEGGGAPDASQERERLTRCKALYSAHQLGTAQSYGYLNDGSATVFHLTFDLSRLFFNIQYLATDSTRTGFIECGVRFGVSVPNYFGHLDRVPHHRWHLSSAAVGDEHEIVYVFADVSMGSVLMAKIEGAGFVVDGTCVDQASLAPTNGAEWRIRFRPTQPQITIDISYERPPRGRRAMLSELRLERTSGPLEGGRYFSTDVEILRTGGLVQLDAPVPGPASTPAVLRDYLDRQATITNLLASGAFHPWPQRPYNFTWLSEAMAAVYGYRVTGDTFFVDWVLRHFDQILAFRDCRRGVMDDARNRVLNGWGGYAPMHREGGHKAWVNEVCTAGCMTLPVLVLCRDIRLSAALRKDYADEAERLIPVCRAVLDEYADEIHVDPKTGGAYLQMPYDGTPEPTAHAAPYAASLAALHAATGEAEPLALAQKFAAYFRASITRDGDGVWSWPYRPAPEKMTGDPAYFFKARIALIFPIVANGLGLLFSDDDMRQFARTFTSAVLDERGQAYTTLSTSERVPLDARQLLHFANRSMAGSLRQMIGYFPLTLFDPEVGRRIDEFVARYNVLFPRGYLSVGFGVESYAVRIDPQRALRPSFSAA